MDPVWHQLTKDERKAARTLSAKLYEEGGLKLELGKFYQDRAQNIWCCYDTWEKDDFLCIVVRNSRGNHVRDRTEKFYSDGRYDKGGTRDFCLEKLVDFKG